MAAVALANRMARIIWAVTVKGGELQSTGSDEGRCGRGIELLVRSVEQRSIGWTRNPQEAREEIVGADSSVARTGASCGGPNWRVAGRTSDKGRGKRSTRRGRNNRQMAEGLQARIPDLDPTSRTPYGPAAGSAASRGRTYDRT